MLDWAAQDDCLYSFYIPCSLEHAEIMRRYEEIERALITADKAFKEAKRRMIQWKAEADEKAPLEDADGKALPLIDELSDLPVETLEEAELALEEAETKANSIVADPNVIRQYEARKREMEQVQAELDDLTGSRERRLDELDQKVKPWEQMLDNSVAKIDALFSAYMREMGCTGKTRKRSNWSRSLLLLKNYVSTYL
jgi:chromosome segregation ATPase